MSGIFDQVINYAPPSLLKGTVTYKGTWSADTNTPTLINPPDSTTNGFYYVVSAAGTQFSLSFNIGDWIISNGSAWEKVDNTDAVSSVFGRTGAVVGVSTDYSAVGITNTALGASNPSTVAATTVTATSTIAATGAVTGSNLSGTNTGDQTITLTGGVTGSGTGSFAATVVTNANLTGVITSVGNATSIASQTGTGTKFVVDTSPTLVTPNIGVATGTSLAAALNGTLGATTPSTIAATTITSKISTATTPITLGAISDYNTYGAISFNNILTNSGRQGIAGGAGDLNLYYSVATGGEHRFAVAGATAVATVTSTGLNSTAIGATTPSTGAFTTVSATGQITSTTTGQFFLNNTPTTQANYMRLTNTSGNMYFGLEGATPILGGTAYDTILVGKTGLSLSGNDGGGTQLRVSSAGAAITGTLSATGAISSTQDGYNTFGSAAGQGLIKIGSVGVPSGDNVGWLVFNTSSNQYNWRISTNTVVSGNLEITPSTAVGGSTFTTPVAKYSTTGLAVTGTLSATGTVTVTGGSINTTYSGAQGNAITNSSDTSGSSFLVFTKSNGATIGSVARVTTTDAITINYSSDRRLKHNIRDFMDSGSLIDGLRPVRFDWNGDKENDDLKDAIGFIAQETHASSPVFARIGAITVGDDDAETITKQWHRSDAALIPILVAELQSLRKRLAALEAK